LLGQHQGNRGSRKKDTWKREEKLANWAGMKTPDKTVNEGTPKKLRGKGEQKGGQGEILEDDQKKGGKEEPVRGKRKKIPKITLGKRQRETEKRLGNHKQRGAFEDKEGRSSPRATPKRTKETSSRGEREGKGRLAKQEEGLKKSKKEEDPGKRRASLVLEEKGWEKMLLWKKEEMRGPENKRKGKTHRREKRSKKAEGTNQRWSVGEEEKKERGEKIGSRESRTVRLKEN